MGQHEVETTTGSGVQDKKNSMIAQASFQWEKFSPRIDSLGRVSTNKIRNYSFANVRK